MEAVICDFDLARIDHSPNWQVWGITPGDCTYSTYGCPNEAPWFVHFPDCGAEIVVHCGDIMAGAHPLWNHKLHGSGDYRTGPELRIGHRHVVTGMRFMVPSCWKACV